MRLKKMLLFLTVICTVILLTACAEKSAFDSLSADKRQIVETVLLHKDALSDCNSIKFGGSEGHMYFITSYTDEYNGNEKFGGAALMKDIKYYSVGGNKFVKEEYDAWDHSRAIGGPAVKWDNTWDEESKKEAVVLAMRNYEIFADAVK